MNNDGLISNYSFLIIKNALQKGIVFDFHRYYPSLFSKKKFPTRFLFWKFPPISFL